MLILKLVPNEVLLRVSRSVTSTSIELSNDVSSASVLAGVIAVVDESDGIETVLRVVAVFDAATPSSGVRSGDVAVTGAELVELADVSEREVATLFSEDDE